MKIKLLIYQKKLSFFFYFIFNLKKNWFCNLVFLYYFMETEKKKEYNCN